MKTLILLCAFLISHITFGQMPYDSITKKFVYEGIVTTKDSATQETVYKNAKQWLTSKLYSADNMVQLDDKNFNILTGTGHIKLEDMNGYVSVVNSRVTFKFSIYCKNSKYKYRIENFRHSYTSVTVRSGLDDVTHDYEAALEEINLGEKRKGKIYAEVNSYVIALINDLEKSMNTSATQNDW